MTERVGIEAKLQEVRNQLEQMRERLLTLPELERQFADLSHRLETLRQVEVNLAKRVEEVRIIRDSTAANLSITQLAKVPNYPLPSKAKLVLIVVSPRREVRNEVRLRFVRFLWDEEPFRHSVIVSAGVQRELRECPRQLVFLNPLDSLGPFGKHASRERRAFAIEHPN